MPEIRYLMFDMDGVLIDTRNWHFEALNQALAMFGHEISLADHLAVFDGLPTRVKLGILSRERGLQTRLHDEIFALKQQHTMALVNQLARPNPATILAFERLQKEGFRICVTSNCAPESLALMSEKIGLRHAFDFMISHRDVRNPKPAPDIYHLAMKRYGARATECMIFEDNEHGIRAALSAGGHLTRILHPDNLTYSFIRAALAGAAGKSKAV